MNGKALRCYALISVTVMLNIAVAMAKPFSSAKGYQITPPSGWKSRSGVMGAEIVFYTRPVHGFASNVNVVVTKAARGERLEQGLAYINVAYPRAFTGYSPLAHGYTTIGGVRAFYITARYQEGTPPLGVRMHQVVALRNNMVYTFTCTALNADYANYDGAFKAALKSVRWAKK